MDFKEILQLLHATGNNAAPLLKYLILRDAVDIATTCGFIAIVGFAVYRAIKWQFCNHRNKMKKILSEIVSIEDFLVTAFNDNEDKYNKSRLKIYLKDLVEVITEEDD